MNSDIKIDDKEKAKSIAWFETQIKTLYKEMHGRFPTNSFRLVYPMRAEQGKLYHFLYTPKYKDELPYWDRFPLIFLLEKYPDGFLGLNFHYLPPQARMLFFNLIKKYKKGSSRGERNWPRLDINYERIKRTQFLQFCIKRYLLIQMNSPLVEIAESNWVNVINLPTAQFKKSTPNVVWRGVR